MWLPRGVLQETTGRQIRRGLPRSPTGKVLKRALSTDATVQQADTNECMNIDDLVAIDIHTHAKIPLHGDEDPLTKRQRLEASAMFKTDVDTAVTVDDVVTHYRERKMAAVVFGVDSEAGTGEVPVSNEEIAEVAAANPDVLIPFASIDPGRGRPAPGKLDA